jgi:hypothetical protein
LGLSPIRAANPVPVLCKTTEKLQELQRMVNEDLESKGLQLSHVVAEHVLTYYRS